MTTEEKYHELLHNLKAMQRVLIAYSGGVDSSFLLRAACEALPSSSIFAATFSTPYTPRSEMEEVATVVKGLEIHHQIISLPLAPKLRTNPAERCYLCKRELFEHLLEHAQSERVSHVLDGTNADDSYEYRPGLRALEELGIESPLGQAGLTKAEIRSLSRSLGLPTWDKPANACLLTRIPHDTQVEESDLIRIDTAEDFLRHNGFPAIRVRCHGNTARLELPPEMISTMLTTKTRQKIDEKLKLLGFRHVSVDLLGYRTGSLD
ncbi:ATP-dependent sacrificial sulfur transferase LarE [Pseudodesulfovibrio piezophilus]|uniref:NAD/GMP synthase domain-containing protein n=1 Tax=Pseudodesulfovibrio piezophilus (strain DSM 21447 / JCM 15486 / C1TLV30) TaxID=1322246 RepID=M1WYE2_PSEP2|nr:ATP-dependent sacrificial sulfur transferase LarE [Pseudodesulfovibrio piezophilus]CCH50298.1 conserved protein of unknown function [Pseudodesulfovibrio piezophilus C1TLV30]